MTCITAIRSALIWAVGFLDRASPAGKAANRSVMR